MTIICGQCDAVFDALDDHNCDREAEAPGYGWGCQLCGLYVPGTGDHYCGSGEPPTARCWKCSLPISECTVPECPAGGTHEVEAPDPSPLETQEGGDHYRTLPIQPVQFIHANKIPYLEGNVIKYVTRWRDKGGLADLRKARHYIDMLIELEKDHDPKP